MNIYFAEIEWQIKFILKISHKLIIKALVLTIKISSVLSLELDYRYKK